MKLTESTITTLKNFADINPGIVVKAGNVIRSVTEATTVIAKADLDQEFPVEFRISDLPMFNSVISLLENPELHFEDKYVIISSGDQKFKYTYASPKVIKEPPENDPKVDFDSGVQFEFRQEDFNNLLKAMDLLKMENIAFIGDGKNIYGATVTDDEEDASANSYVVKLGETDKEFRIVFRARNLLMVRGDYTVSLIDKKISRFIGGGRTYWVGIKSESVFGQLSEKHKTAIGI